MYEHFWETYGRVTQEEGEDNKDRLTAACQPHKGFKDLVAQIKTYLVYSHFTKKVIPNEDLINAFLVVIKQKGCYQVGDNTGELTPEAQWTSRTNAKFW